MVYVQYYQKVYSPTLQMEYLGEVCGDRGVVILDGRNTLENMIADAAKFNGIRRPVYEAARIFKGRSLLDSQPITGIFKL